MSGEKATEAVFLGTAPATKKNYRQAATVAILLLIAFGITMPFASRSLSVVPAFVPIYNALICILDLITAFLLFAQFKQLKQRSFLALTCGYIFAPLIIIAHAISFPDAFKPGSLIGGDQTTAWLWVGWHSLFPLFIATYAIYRRREAPANTHKQLKPFNTRKAKTALFATIVLAIGIILVTTMGGQMLPQLMIGHIYRSGTTNLILAFGWATHLFALALMAWLTRFRRLIDVWLSVTLVALTIDLALSALLVNGRYEVGFYMGRLYGILAACFILSVLLKETISLYGQAVNASIILREREEQLKNFNAMLEKEVAEQTGELQEKNKQLQQTIKQLESFNYLTSHDLQEPLRKIQTFVELLHEYRHDEHMRDEYAKKIRDSSERMSKLIQSLLDYSRLWQTAEAFQQTDLNTILEQVKFDYEVRITEKQAVIKSEKLPVIRAIPFQMYQLFSNLISNSLKFCDTIPEITITSKIVNGFAVIKFSDNGIGFDNKYKEKMFRIFQRLHPPSKYSGTGIGLSIVEKIIQNHNGSIEAESQKGSGATFTIYLPVT